MFYLVFPPHHLVYHPDVGLDDANNLGGHILVHVVGHGDAREAVADEGDGNVHTLEKADGVDATENEAAFVQGLGALGRCPDADGREGMPDTREEGRLLREGTAVRHDGEGVHLQAVVVMEAQGLVADHARVQHKTGGLEALPGAGGESEGN